MLDYKITLINNNIFYDWYPNSSNFNFPDQLEEIEKLDKFQPDDLFKSFYSSSKNIGKDEFVTYFDLLSDDFDSIDKIDFYDNIEKIKI